jgi:hypothetical protein
MQVGNNLLATPTSTSHKINLPMFIDMAVCNKTSHNQWSIKTSHRRNLPVHTQPLCRTPLCRTELSLWSIIHHIHHFLPMHNRHHLRIHNTKCITAPFNGENITCPTYCEQFNFAPKITLSLNTNCFNALTPVSRLDARLARSIILSTVSHLFQRHHYLVLRRGVWSRETSFLHRISFGFGELPTVFRRWCWCRTWHSHNARSMILITIASACNRNHSRCLWRTVATKSATMQRLLSGQLLTVFTFSCQCWDSTHA